MDEIEKLDSFDSRIKIDLIEKDKNEFKSGNLKMEPNKAEIKSFLNMCSTSLSFANLKSLQ